MLLVFLFIHSFDHGLLKATHIIGGEIFYDCLGNNQFRITLKLYRDCLLGQAPFDDPATISVYNSTGTLVENIQIPFPGSNIVPTQSFNPCYQGEGDLCVEEAVYVQNVSLPFDANGYTLVYQRCCRNQSILNIAQPGETGSTYASFIPGSAWNDCNSSPRCNNFPPIVLCVNDPLVFDHSATDPDGDSLVYSFCDPFEGASTDAPMPVPAAAPPFQFVNFVAPYSAGFPIASAPSVLVNSQTGLITGTPRQLGQYVVAVCVSEFRNGQLLSVNKRDFQFNVVNCSGESTAIFDAPLSNINTGAVCLGLSVLFINQSLNASYYYWDFGVPGLTTDVSDLFTPSYEFPDTGTFLVSLIANPGYSCADTAYTTIAVYDELVAEILPQLPQCIIGNNFSFQLDRQQDPSTNFLWEFGGNASLSISNSRNPQVSWQEAGTFSIYITLTTPHCIDHDTLIITVFPPLTSQFSIDQRDGCLPLTINFSSSAASLAGTNFYWDFGDGSTSNQGIGSHTYALAGFYSIGFEVSSSIGCLDTLSDLLVNYIRVRPRPNAMFEASPKIQSILNPVVRFTDLSTDNSGSWLLPGTGIRLDLPDVFFTYPDTGWFNAQLIASNEQGCYDTASIPIRIEPLFTCYIPNSFSPNEDQVNDTFSPKGEGFKQYKFVIYNRWGQTVFESSNPHESWDGRCKRESSISQTEVYVYKLWILDVLGEKHSYTGRVTLFR